MKIAILSNSHVTALKRAWDEDGGRHPRHELVFFASRQDELGELREEGGKLVPSSAAVAKVIKRTSGGRGEVDPSEFGMLVCHAMRASIRLLGDFRRRCAFVASSVGERQFVSRDCALELCKDLLRDALLFQLAGRIRKITALPLVVSAEPHPAFQSARGIAHGRVKDPGDPVETAALAGLFAEAFRDAAGECADHALLQPAESVLHEVFTHPDYNAGATRLDAGKMMLSHRKLDRFHMNARYGRLVLERILAIADTSGPAVAARPPERYDMPH